MNSTKVYLVERKRKLTGKVALYHVLRWAGSNGKTRQQTIGLASKSGGDISAKEAKRLRQRKEHDINEGRAPLNRPRRMTLSQYIDAHERSESFGKRASTIREWRYAGNHAIAALGDVPLDTLTWEAAGRVREHLDDRSDATVRKTLATLRAIFNRAVKRGLLHKNPFADEKLGPSHERPKRIYTDAEIDAMVNVAPSLSWQALIRLAATSGLRWSELMHLRWSDVDMDLCTVRVERHDAGRYKVRDGLEVLILAWEPKTPKSTRTVPIPPEPITLLLRLQAKSQGSPYVFLTLNRLRVLDRRLTSGRPITEPVCNFPRDFNDLQAKAAKKLEAKNWKRGCFHDLRKTFGTRAAQAGVPMHELQAHMGHSSITTTAKYYTAVEASAAERLRAVFVRTA